VLQAALLARHATPAVFDAFCASRLAAQADTFGLLPPSTPFDAILDRALPT
jgi:putative acyl-CoA dehydrogenase